MIKYIILSLCFIAFIYIIIRIIRNRIEYKLLNKYTNRDMDEYFNILNKFATRLFLSRYSIEYMKLNGYFLLNDDIKIDEQFKTLYYLANNINRKNDIVLRTFHYYLDLENEERSRYYLNELNKLNNSEIYNECKMLYDILLKNESCYIENLKDKLNNMDNSDEKKKYYCYLIYLQYKYINDMENANYFLKKSEE